METTSERRWARHIVVDATVRHPVGVVFPYLADPTKWHDFAPAVEFREQIDPGPPRVGTRWRGTDRIGPFRAHFIDRLDLIDENRRVVWVSSAPWNARVEYVCEEAGMETRIRADYYGELSDSLRWQAGWIPIWAWHHLILAQDFRRLDRLLTRKVRAAGRWETAQVTSSTIIRASTGSIATIATIGQMKSGSRRGTAPEWRGRGEVADGIETSS